MAQASASEFFTRAVLVRFFQVGWLRGCASCSVDSLAVFSDAVGDGAEVEALEAFGEDVREGGVFGEVVGVACFFEEVQIAEAFELASDVAGRDAGESERVCGAVRFDAGFDLFAGEGLLRVEQCVEDVYDHVAAISGLKDAEGEAEFFGEVAAGEFVWFFVAAEGDLAEGSVVHSGSEASFA